MNNRQNGRRRSRGGVSRPNGGSTNQNNSSRIDNRARGNASQLFEKYKNLARDAQLQGDRVMNEYYLQFADHYFRILNESRVRFEERRRQRDDQYDYNDEDGQQDSDQDLDQERDDGYHNYTPAPERQQQNRPERQERADRQDRQQSDRQYSDRQPSARQDRPDRQDRSERQDRQQQDRPDRQQRAPRRDYRQQNEGAESVAPQDSVEVPAEGYAAAPVQTQPVSEDEGASRPRRGRGRRPSSYEADIGADDGQEARISADILPPAIGTDTQASESPVVSAEEDEAPKPRRRGRPRKVQADADEAAV